MLVPLNITGGTYQGRALSLSNQRTINFWPQRIDDPYAKSRYVLNSFYGLRAFATGSGSGGGLFEHQGIGYKVTGTTLYSFNISGTLTSLGTIPGTGQCWFAGIVSNVLVIRAGRVWIWNLTTLTEVTDVDLETPNGADHLNNQIIYDGDNGRFASSDVGDGSSIDSLNYATAESNVDNLQVPYVFNQNVYLFGDRTIEPWWNSGSGSPPFDRIEGGIIQIGLGAIHSISHNKDSMYFLGHDKRIYITNGPGQAISVSSRSITLAIEGMVDSSDAIGWCFTLENQYFYLITFPSGNRTFVYPEAGQWFELSSDTSGGKFNGTSYCYVYNKHLVEFDGNILEWHKDTFTENGSVIRRVRDSGPIHGGLFGKPGKTITMNRFELIMEQGVGLISGQGSEPKVMLSFSDDGGKTYSPEMWGNVGPMGNYIYRIDWNVLGSFESRIVRVAVSDPVFYSIHSASMDIEIGI